MTTPSESVFVENMDLNVDKNLWENTSPEKETNNVLGFTSHLFSTLEKSRSQIDKFCKSSKLNIDKACDDNSKTFEKEQNQIYNLVRNLHQLKYYRGISSSPPSKTQLEEHKESDDFDPTKTIAAQKSMLQEQQSNLEKELASVYTEHKDKQNILQETQKREDIHRLKAKETRQAKLRVEEAKQTTVEDLSLGVLKYKKLGLNFEKVAENQLRFIFTMIDPTKPRRKFSFVLSANDEELYELLECEPPLNSNKAMSHLDHLNESSDISQFVRCMRREFKESLVLYG